MLQPGDVFYSLGGSIRYEVIGAVCRLYDREELPYPCCRLQWQGKEPFWNRVGKRFVPDLGARRCESYNVKLLGYAEERIFSFYYKKLSPDDLAWWFTLNKKAERYVSEVIFHDGHTEQPIEAFCLREVGIVGRDTSYSINGDERDSVLSVSRRLEDS